MPPPGIYMFNQVFTYQSNFVGPAAAGLKSGQIQAKQRWTLKASFSCRAGPSWARPMTPSSCSHSSRQLSASRSTSWWSGVHNTYFTPIELTWNHSGGSDFAVKRAFLSTLRPARSRGQQGLPA